MSPDEIDVDENGCSCTTLPAGLAARWAGIDPACPLHGVPRRPGDPALHIYHPDGTLTVLTENGGAGA